MDTAKPLSSLSLIITVPFLSPRYLAESFEDLSESDKEILDKYA